MNNKIYVIVNLSHEWGEADDMTIMFTSTSYAKAIECWNKYYIHMKDMDDVKWHYMAELREYKDGFDFYSVDGAFTVLKHVDNAK